MASGSARTMDLLVGCTGVERGVRDAGGKVGLARRRRARRTDLPLDERSAHVAIGTHIKRTLGVIQTPVSKQWWAVALKTQFSPSALAYRVASDLGPFLSPAAKARQGGVRVRASFCLGAREERRVANDIFDLDIRIGGEDQVLEFVGPREEGETGRWWAKMGGRQWF